MRLLCVSNQGAFEHLDEETAWRLARKFSDPKVKRILQRVKAENETERKFIAAVRAIPELRSWWKSSQSFRSPRTFVGWKQIEAELNAPHLEPYEVARLRLGDDISMDADVVAVCAWAHGVEREWAGRFDTWREHSACLRSGLRKIHTSPWIALILAAPFMAPAGVFFPGHGMMESALRMERILKNPWTATDGEIGHILNSPTFKAGYDRARQVRRQGGYVLHAGPWYACGLANPLGEHFRRACARTGRKT